MAQKINYKPILIIGGILLVSGLGYYLYTVNKKKGSSSEGIDTANGSELEPAAVTSAQTAVSPVTPSTNGGKYPATPFPSEARGNAFREYMNNRNPQWSKDNALDRKGAYDNEYIRKAYFLFKTPYSRFLNDIKAATEKVSTMTNGYTIVLNKPALSAADGKWWDAYYKVVFPPKTLK